MAQNVKKPRFYINLLEWVEATGVAKMSELVLLSEGNQAEHYRTLPVNPIFHTGNSITLYYPSIPITLNNPFIAFLGHNIVQNYSFDVNRSHDIINGYPEQGTKGFSITILDDPPSLYRLNADTGVGSVIIGSYYDMENTANLSLTMSRDYGSVKEFTTINGSSMSNSMWNKPARWGAHGAWELYTFDGTEKQLSRSGRRIWDLEFSYIDNGNLWGSNQSPSTDILLATWGGDPTDYDQTTGTGGEDVIDGKLWFDIFTDNSFFSQVWHMTAGGTIPFIFQPDGDGDIPGSGNNNPDQFAICRFKNNSLKATQTAFNVYDISLSIEEVW